MIELKRSDGVHKKLRPQQKAALAWLESNLGLSPKAGMELKTGTGKTAILRCIQRSFPEGTVDCISYSNHLVNDFVDTYGTNSLKGRAHYDDPQDYMEARRRARSEATIFNPYSWIYYAESMGGRHPQVIVFDEAHKMLAMLHDFSTISVKLTRLADKHALRDSAPDDFAVQEILERELARSIKKPETMVDELRIKEMKTRLRTIKQDLLDHPECYTVSLRSSAANRVSRTHYLDITPIKPPEHLIEKLFPADYHICLSGTMPEVIYKEMFPEGRFKAFPHPVDAAYRPVISYAMPEEDRDNLAYQAYLIDLIIEREGRPNTLIHTTYHESRLLADHMKTPAITHSKRTKGRAIDQFKEHGGVLLGAGMAEGISFPDNECNLIIIPKLPFPSLGDLYVRKRKACQDGVFWYKIQTMLTLWQQAGRGCRHADDHCKIYVLDPLFGRLMLEVGKYFDDSLNNSVVWNPSKELTCS